MSNESTVIAYADGSCLGNPGPGGWGVVLIGNDGARLEFAGAVASTTNNRMEITAAIEALRRLKAGTEVTIRSDSQYLVNTMTQRWKRRENLDLWKILDAEVGQRHVRWEWVRGHSGEVLNDRADELARTAALGKPKVPQVDGPLETDASAPKPTLFSKVEPADARSEADVVRLLRPLLHEGESVRRCASCHQAFVTTGDPPRMQAYCMLAACQLKRRGTSSR
jgi:ribonuclease HI